MEEVHLVQVGRVDRSVIGFLAACLRDQLSVRPVFVEKTIDVRFAFDRSRGQYRSSEILAAIVALGAEREGRLLGVADVDLFIPIFTFVFGEAQLGGRAALLSLTRLRQDFYGLPPREDLLYLRAEKEATHELGHTYGLVHCTDYECAMHFSSSVEEIDLKSNAYCGACDARRRDARGVASP